MSKLHSFERVHYPFKKMKDDSRKKIVINCSGREIFKSESWRRLLPLIVTSDLSQRPPAKQAQTRKKEDFCLRSLGRAVSALKFQNRHFVVQAQPIDKDNKRVAEAALKLSGPISRDIAILSLRYPISRDTFSGRLALPQNCAIPRFTQAHLCDTPFCNISRDNCAIPHKNKHENVLR